MNADPFDIPPGTVLAGTKYRVVKRLGAGGMGAVFKAEHVSLGNHVCIKFLHPDIRERADYRQRFETEARTLARLDHPGIVKATDYGSTDDGHLFLVMEFLNGKDLRKILHKQRFLALSDAIGVAQDVLEALAHAHREGVVHRDIKPENIFLIERGHVTETKLVDFGIARVVADPRRLTAGRFVGTCQYAAPEQCTNSTVTDKTDLYAVGCVLFELITGRRVFPGPTAGEYVAQHVGWDAPRLSSLVAVPPALDALVASALSKDPKARPASALWFATQLHQIAQLAEGHELVNANTTSEMLITAVTEGLSSSKDLLAAASTVEERRRSSPNDTCPHGSLADYVEARSPHEADRTAPMGRGHVADRSPPPRLGLRDARTRTSPPPGPRPLPRAGTEPIEDDEDMARRDDAARASTSAATVLDAVPSGVSRAPRSTRPPAGRHDRQRGPRWHWPVAAALLLTGASSAGLILAFGRKGPMPPPSSAAPAMPSASGARSTPTGASMDLSPAAPASLSAIPHTRSPESKPRVAAPTSPPSHESKGSAGPASAQTAVPAPRSTAKPASPDPGGRAQGLIPGVGSSSRPSTTPPAAPTVSGGIELIRTL